MYKIFSCSYSLKSHGSVCPVLGVKEKRFTVQIKAAPCKKFQPSTCIDRFFIGQM